MVTSVILLPVKLSVLHVSYQFLKVLLLLVAVLIVFFPVMVNVLTSMRTVDPDMVNLARAFSATRWQIFRMIEYPASLPPLFSGLRIGATLAVQAKTAAKVAAVAASSTTWRRAVERSPSLTRDTLGRAYRKLHEQMRSNDARLSNELRQLQHEQARQRAARQVEQRVLVEERILRPVAGAGVVAGLPDGRRPDEHEEGDDARGVERGGDQVGGDHGAPFFRVAT